MARYRGPRLRIIRRIGTDLPGLTTKNAGRKPLPPGHAAASNRRPPKMSEHGLRQREKQKLRYHYGVTERALRLVYERASRMQGDTGHNMLNLLEARLDNIVWRAGFTRTIPAARQLIAHGHVELNGVRAKTPSQLLKSGGVVALREKAQKREDIRLCANGPLMEVPAGIQVDLDKLAITVESTPNYDNLPYQVDIQKVIEFYAK